jgi:rSAM/selenodomain-associated transferase 1
MSMSAEASTALLIFARAPQAGHTKTRLIPLLGAQGAALLHERMIARALVAAEAAALGPIELWCAPSSSHPFFAGCVQRHRLSLHEQVGVSLGDSLRHAHDDAFKRHGCILMIGTDCPVLTTTHLQRAAIALQSHEAVIIPAEDGGYVLLGLKGPCPQVFANIAWSTADVFEQTMARLREANRSCRVLETLWDVDRPQDHARLRATMPDITTIRDADKSLGASQP